MRRRRMFFYVKHKGNIALIALLVIIVILGVTVMGVESKIRPIVREMAVSRAQYVGTKAVTAAINEEMEKNQVEYDDVVQFEKDFSGNIIAVKTDIGKMNRLKANIIGSVSEKLDSGVASEILIPIGNLINGELFTGRGPKIRIKVLPISSVNAEFASEFTSAGINQTRHRILINTRVNMSVMLPGGAVSTQVESEVSIAETVLIGNVPDSYTNIEDNQSQLLEKLNNYVIN